MNWGFPVDYELAKGEKDMNSHEVKSRLAAHSEELQRMGVISLALFGSAGRNESSTASDVDPLVEFDRPVSLFHLFSLQHRLEDILGVQHVDLVQGGSVHPALRERILTEAVRVA
jgi:predicted nucleotidyltransferase